MKRHEPESYETINSVAGPFFIIYSFKHVKDQINILNLKKTLKILNILDSENCLKFSDLDYPKQGNDIMLSGILVLVKS